MRLGQFARKYDIRVQDIISYLEKTDEEIHSNTKLSEKDETEILDFFGIEAQEEIEVIEPPKVIEEHGEKEAVDKLPKIKEEKVVVDDDAWIEEDEPVIVEKPKEEKKEVEENIEVVESKKTPHLPATPEEDIALVEGEIDFMPIQNNQLDENNEQQESEEQPEKVVAPIDSEKKPEPKEDEVIDTERLMELLESEDEVPELDKIKLIKAPKKELSGLKVLGKVELPEPKKKEPTEKEESEKEIAQDIRNQRTQISNEEREKRRLNAKKKKEEFEAREKRRLKEKEEKEKRDRNASHYKQKLNQPKPKKKKPTPKKVPAPIPVEELASPVPQKPKVKKKKVAEPTTLLGRMWKWMTDPDQ